MRKLLLACAMATCMSSSGIAQPNVFQLEADTRCYISDGTTEVRVPCRGEQENITYPVGPYPAHELHCPTKFHWRLKAGITDDGFQMFLNGQAVGGAIESGTDFAAVWFWVHHNLDDVLEKIGYTRKKEK